MGRLPARLEATREGHPATDWGHLPQIFKDRRRRSGHPEDRGALPAVQPYLRASRFQGCRCLRATARPALTEQTIGGLSKREENPPQGLRRCLWARLRHRGAASAETESRTLPHPGPGISTWFPFAGGHDAPQQLAPCEASTKRRASVPCRLQEAGPCCHELTSPSCRIRWEPPRHRDDARASPHTAPPRNRAPSARHHPTA